MSTIHNPTNLKVNTGTLLSQLSLARTNDALTRSIRNLSTGLRIESGRDDPVGFIAGSSMRTDLATMKQAVSNSQRADKAISLIDSTLANVTSLLNDLRGIITQAANTGVENTATLASLQLQADTIINTIDYFSSSTTFNGQKLLDGSLNFSLFGADKNSLQKIDINQANFNGRTEKDIVTKIIEPPERAELYYQLGGLADDTIFTVGGINGYQLFNFDKTATLSDIANAVNLYSDATGVAAKVHAQGTTGSTSISSYGKNNDIILTASKTGKENGNFVVKYSAPQQGNDSAFLNVTRGSGNDPTVIEVVLQTEKWSNAEYVFNKDGDNVTNNEFNIVAKYAGAEFNDINFEINNIFNDTSGEVTGIDVDLVESPKTFRINISYDENNPNDPTNTTVNDLASWIAASPVASAYFELQHTGQSNGNGVIIPDGKIETLTQGIDGGKVITTAEQIATLINTSPLLKNADGSGRLSATIPSDAFGIGAVSPFFDAAYYGSPQENNYLQFLAPANSPSIKFVSNPNEQLSIDLTSEPPLYDYASAAIQGFDHETSFTIKSRETGLENDNVTIIMRDSVDESAVFDPEKNAVVISVDFTGRQNGTNLDGAFTMNDLVALVESDQIVGERFIVVPQSGYDTTDPPAFKNEAYVGINSEVGKMSGGLISAGTVVIHLETDANGIVKTTANELVKFFNDPTTLESQAALDKLGISVSVISPGNVNETVSTTGNSEIGSGLLRATDTVDGKIEQSGTESNWNFGDIEFGKSLMGEVKASAFMLARNGIDAVFQVTARSAEAKYDGTEIVVMPSDSGTSVFYDAQSKQITIGIDSTNPPTAFEVVELINSTKGVAEYFSAVVANSASVLPDSQSGSAPISVGDRGTLRVFYSDNVISGAAGLSMLGGSDSEEMGLTFYSLKYGSEEFVDVVAGQGTSFQVKDKYGEIKERDYGSDIVATINNQASIGKGRVVMSATSDLDVSLWMDGDVGVGEVIEFRIAGGGVLIQLGAVATSNQQARIGVPSIHSSQLGGVSGFLSDIKSNGVSDLRADIGAAFRIVEEVTAEISELRSRLGAFQKNRIEPNIDNITDAIEIETSAMSDIVDTDFAVESSELLRQQLLMQSNITALQMSMQSRQMLLSLLTG
jgi:flagellin-like hook-associated protein FlgL